MSRKRSENEDGGFYLRYYQGHKGTFGHEFLEFEFQSNSSRMRYANNSQYKNEKMIRKECNVSSAVLDELKRLVQSCEVLKEDDNLWPQPSRVGMQELEVMIDDMHVSFSLSKIGTLEDCDNSKDPEGLRCFHYFVQDLKLFVFALISMHFKIDPYSQDGRKLKE